MNAAAAVLAVDDNATIRKAISMRLGAQGFDVVTAADACADFERGRHEASLRKMDQSFGYVVPTDAVLGCWA